VKQLAATFAVSEATIYNCSVPVAKHEKGLTRAFCGDLRLQLGER